MSMRRLANAWLDSGRTWLLKSTSPTARVAAQASGQISTEPRFTPPARNAVISLSWDSLPKVMSTATSTAQGADRATM